MAWLYLGFYMALYFHKTYRTITQDKLKELEIRCFETLYKIAVDHSKLVSLDKPTDKFIKKLNALFLSKTVYVVNKNSFAINSNDGFIGYEDDDYYYLIADIVHKKVKRLCEEQGEIFSISARGLLEQLADENLIEVRDNKNTILLRTSEKPIKLMWLKKRAVEDIVS